MEKGFFRRDALLALCALAFSLGAIVCFFLLKKEGAYATVLVGGEVHSRHPLSRDNLLEISTEYGHNRLKIENGKASIVYADCPDGLCVNHHPVSCAGESIVCLPNKLVVEIRDE
ncbi:MAG: NusG domain II-containing protein [Clostridia bacterium]|nr:NusG domain II-containing protein [Clostridia bacterium]